MGGVKTPGRIRFGAALQTLRKDTGLTQAGLAKALGTTTGLIGHAEAGRRYLPADVRSTAAKFFGVDPDLLGPEHPELARLRTGQKPQERGDKSGEQQPAEGEKSRKQKATTASIKLARQAKYGLKIRRARESAGLSAAAVARQLESTAGKVYAWERGESLPDAATRKKLQEVLGVIDVLQKEGPEQPPESAQPVPEPAPERKRGKVTVLPPACPAVKPTRPRKWHPDYLDWTAMEARKAGMNYGDWMARTDEASRKAAWYASGFAPRESISIYETAGVQCARDNSR